MITTRNLHELRPLNFGMRALREPATAEVIAREVARYDPVDAAAVSHQVRSCAGHEALVDELLAVYAEVLIEHGSKLDDPAAEQRAAGLYLQSLAPRLHQRDLLKAAFARLLRVPVAGTLLRRRAAREPDSHWFPQLLRSMDHD